MRTEPTILNNRLPNGYAIVMTYVAGSNAARPLASGGMIVLFDTVAIAQQFLPLLGTGRIPTWTADGETVCFTPIDITGINRAVIVTDYNPFDVPVGFPGGIRSETKGREWKHHVMWSHAFYDCGQMEKKRDGSVINSAVPMIAAPTPERFAAVQEI